jgi:hypothetical protein
MMEKPGQPIAGSTMIRAFCFFCGDPIRVTQYAWENQARHYCSACYANNRSKHDSGRVKRHYSKADGVDDNPWEQKVVRELEDE